jgi:uroporphyrinogen decarboxylase
MQPDFILTGFSGCLTFQTPAIFRDLGLPTLQKLTRLAKDAGVATQVHSCGPERALVEICAKETDLSSINPLERPPMGDCDLAEIKRLFGADIGLMGNLHTTEHMLHGTPELVARESRWCIDVAAEGGGFILSTGDQCGRDTPDANLYAMIEVARTHGVY